MIDRNKDIFTVRWLRDSERWVGQCPAIGLFVETDSYDELIDVSQDLAADLYVDNGLGTDPSRMQLDFLEVGKGEFSDDQTDEEFHEWLNDCITIIDAESAKHERRTA